MGTGKADAEIAKVIARHAKKQAGQEPSTATSEWRWSHSGWGPGSLPSSLKSAIAAGAEADPATDEKDKS